jgi:hypothetical protein
VDLLLLAQRIDESRGEGFHQVCLSFEEASDLVAKIQEMIKTATDLENYADQYDRGAVRGLALRGKRFEVKQAINAITGR